MHPVLLLNTTIATAYPASFELSAPISAEEAQLFLEGKETFSAIGHEASATAISALLGQEIKVNRVPSVQQIGQTAIVLKLRGRLPEGVILDRAQMEEIGYDLLYMVRTK